MNNRLSSDTSAIEKRGAGYRTREENAIFFKDGMERLRTEPLQECTGKMIGEMIDFSPSKSLVVYARRWLAHYPDHEYAPKLVGLWLQKYDPNEAMYLAEYYLRTVSKTINLRALLRAVGASKRHPRRIYDLIEARLEKEPYDDVWSCLQQNLNPACNRVCRG
jgi:hypothetical protein